MPDYEVPFNFEYAFLVHFKQWWVGTASTGISKSKGVKE